MQPALLRVGQRVRARREADLPAELAVVRSVSEGATCTVRFEDGFLLAGIPAHALAEDDTRAESGLERLERGAEEESDRAEAGSDPRSAFVVPPPFACSAS